MFDIICVGFGGTAQGLEDRRLSKALPPLFQDPCPVVPKLVPPVFPGLHFMAPGLLGVASLCFLLPSPFLPPPPAPLPSGNHRLVLRI